MNNAGPSGDPTNRPASANSTARGNAESKDASASRPPPPEFSGHMEIFRFFTDHVQHACLEKEPALLQNHPALLADSQTQQTETINSDEQLTCFSPRNMSLNEFGWAARHLQDLERAQNSTELWKRLHELNYPSFLKQQVSLARETGCKYPPLGDGSEHLRTPEVCGICSEPIPPEAHDQNKFHHCLTCGMVYCVDCLEKLFTTALEDSTRMPAGCCVLFPTYVALLALTPEKVDEYRTKFEEHIAPTRTYCPIPTCSAFLPSRIFLNASTEKKDKRPDTPAESTPDVFSLPQIACPKCKIAICVSCRQVTHSGTMCAPPPQLDKKTARALKRWGYKRCPRCGHGVKRMFGCTHMQCRCGAHWCWHCCKPMDDCSDTNEYDSAGEDESETSDEDDEYEDEDEQEDMPAENVDNPDVEGAQTMATAPDALSTANTPDADQIQSDPSAGSDARTSEGPSVAQSADQAADQTATESSQTTAPAAETQRRRRRRENLDDGEDWEASGLDFGDEPYDDGQDWSWRCVHTNLKELTGPAQGAECLLCWRPLVSEGNSKGRLEVIEAAMARLDARVEARKESRPYEGESPGWACISCGMVLCASCRKT